MMKILLVEDAEDKRDELCEFLKENIDCDILVAKSFQSGLKAIKENVFDLLLLDMSMPTFDISLSESGGRDQPFGGELLLAELMRREINTKAIVVTQFDLFGTGDDLITVEDLDMRLQDTFQDNYMGIVQYSIRHSGWEENLLKKING